MRKLGRAMSVEERMKLEDEEICHNLKRGVRTDFGGGVSDMDSPTRKERVVLKRFADADEENAKWLSTLSPEDQLMVGKLGVFTAQYTAKGIQERNKPYVEEVARRLGLRKVYVEGADVIKI